MKVLFWIAVIIIALPIVRYVVLRMRAGDDKSDDDKQQPDETDSKK